MGEAVRYYKDGSTEYVAPYTRRSIKIRIAIPDDPLFEEALLDMAFGKRDYVERELSIKLMDTCLRKKYYEFFKTCYRCPFRSVCPLWRPKWIKKNYGKLRAEYGLAIEEVVKRHKYLRKVLGLEPRSR